MWFIRHSCVPWPHVGAYCIRPFPIHGDVHCSITQHSDVVLRGQEKDLLEGLKQEVEFWGELSQGKDQQRRDREVDGLVKFLEKFFPRGVVLIDLCKQKIGWIAVQHLRAGLRVGFEMDVVAGAAKELKQRACVAPKRAWACHQELFFLAWSGDAYRLEPLEKVGCAKGKAAVMTPMKAVKVDASLFFEHGNVYAHLIFDACA